MDGLNLNLRKRKLNSPSNPLDADAFFVWGYFDALNIEKVSNWQSFLRLDDSEKLSGDFSSQLMLKLVSPQHKRELQEKYKLKYDAWDNATHSYFAGKPLLSVILLHYTMDFIKQHDNDIDTLIDETVSRFIKATPESERENHVFAVYPSLGFVDAVILCRSNNYRRVADTVYNMRSEPGFLASSYILPSVLSSASMEDMGIWENHPNDKNTYLSVRGTLKPGASFKSVINTCRNAFKDKLGIEIPEGNNSILRLSKMFGFSDIMLAPDIPASQIYKLYRNNNKISQPLFGDIFTTSFASIRIFSDECTGSEDPPEFIEPPNRAHFKRNITTSLNRTIKDLVSDNLYEYLFNTLHFYYDVTGCSHMSEISGMMDAALTSLNEILQLVKIQHKRSSDEIKSEYETKLNEALNVFTNDFHSLVSDFSRADRHLFENRLIHSAVASASKLIILYDKLVKKLAVMFTHDINRCTFLTTSGNGVLISANRLFSFVVPYWNDHRTIRDPKIIILRISEDDLYKISITMFRVIHEVFHFCYPVYKHSVIESAEAKYVMNKNPFIIQSLASFVSDSIIEQLFGMNNDTDIYNYYVNLTDNLATIGKQVQAKGIIEIYSNTVKIIKSELAELFEVAWEKHKKDIIFPEFAIIWRDKLCKAIQNDFDTLIAETPKEPVGMEIQNRFGAALEGNNYTLLDLTVEIIKKYVLYMNRVIDSCMHGQSSQMDVDGARARDIYMDYINRAESNYPVSKFLTIIISALHTHLNKITWYQKLTDSAAENVISISRMVNDISDAYAESLADLGSISILGVCGTRAGFNLYLRTFINGEKYLLTDKLDDMLRIGSIIKICFNDEYEILRKGMFPDGIPEELNGIKGHIIEYTQWYAEQDAGITVPLEKCLSHGFEIIADYLQNADESTKELLSDLKTMFSENRNDIDDFLASKFYAVWRCLSK
jgi:hypothetical protein